MPSEPHTDRRKLARPQRNRYGRAAVELRRRNKTPGLSRQGARGRGRVLGLDLAGSPLRATGACLLSGLSRIWATVLHSDLEIVRLAESSSPDLVVIDAPLSLPRGRKTIEDRSGPHLRECDRELLSRRIPFFPLTLGPMRMLTLRGMKIARTLRRRGFEVVEGYPGGAQDLLGLPRKQAGERRLQQGLRRRGLRDELDRRDLTHDELDAVTIAWVGWRYQNGHGELIGDPSEGLMLLPEATSSRARREQGVRRLPGRRSTRVSRREGRGALPPRRRPAQRGDRGQRAGAG